MILKGSSCGLESSAMLDCQQCWIERSAMLA